MTSWQAVLLGLVEGITEYLPVSSTGHLLVAERLLGLPETEATKAYAVVIQAGAILAVLGLYAQRIKGMAEGVIGRNPEGRTLALHLILAFIPAVVLGGLFDDTIEAVLFGAWPIVIAWAVGGVAILAFFREPRAEGLALSSLTAKSALLIGLAQCVAMWPGTSRSFATIVGGLLVGLSMPAAVEFAFLLGLITLGAATCLKALKSGDVLMAEVGMTNIVIGLATAGISATIAVKWMVGWIQQRGMGVFGIWRLVAALLVAALLLSGRI